ncbi:Hypp8120 [Branchiostoma lanceolatum]|uniref:Hypp8120 protein n=1 Tax=Branchiostoma lanceolatum TaxID=7740 RepID=A0A8J9Z732_BRALA|nr:Hypp8120 [Branchiostoma lanceolatum]
MASHARALWAAAALCSVLGMVGSAPVGRGMFVWGCRFVLEVNSSMSGRLTLDGSPVKTSCSFMNHQGVIRHTPGQASSQGVIRHTPGQAGSQGVIRHTPGQAGSQGVIRHTPGQAGSAGVVVKFTDDLAEKGQIYVRCGQVVSCLQVLSPDYLTVLKHKSRTLMAAVDISHHAPVFPIILVGVVSGVVILLAMLLLCAACTQKQVSEEVVPTAKDSGVTITRSRSLNVDSRNIVSADQGSRLAAHDRPESGELLGVGMATKENGAVGVSGAEAGDPDWHRKSMSSRKLPELPTPPPTDGGGDGKGQKSSQQGKEVDTSEPLQESQYESASSRGAEGPYESIPDRNFPSQDDLYEAVKDEESGGRRREAGYARMKDVEQQGSAGGQPGETAAAVGGAESIELAEVAPPVPVKNYDPNDVLENGDGTVQQAAVAVDSKKTPDYTEVTARESLASIRQREAAASQANPNVYYEVQDNVYAQVDNGPTPSGSTAGPAPLTTPPPLPDAHPPGRSNLSPAPGGGPPALRTTAPDSVHLHLPDPSRNSTASDMRDYEEINDMPIAVPPSDLYETVGGDQPAAAAVSRPTAAAGQAVYAKINKERSKSTKEGQVMPNPQDRGNKAHTIHAVDHHSLQATLGVAGSQVNELYAQVNKSNRKSQKSSRGHGNEVEPPYSKVKESTGGDRAEPPYSRVKESVGGGQVEPPNSRVNDGGDPTGQEGATSGLVDARDDGYATLKDPQGMGARAGIPSAPGGPLGRTTVVAEGEDLEGYENLGDWQPDAVTPKDQQGASPGQRKLGETFWQKAEHLYDEIPQAKAEDEDLIPTTEL